MPSAALRGAQSTYTATVTGWWVVPVSATGTALPTPLPAGPPHPYPRGAIGLSGPRGNLDPMDAHPHDPPTRKAQALLRTRFSQLMDHSVMHLRVDYRDDRQLLQVLGSASHLHGPQGQCTCCPRRPRLTVDGDPVG